MREKKIRWQNWVRQQELNAIKKWFIAKVTEKANLLEIGGGDGFLARCLADMGFDVVSIDIEPREPSCFPVEKGDCTCLEFEDKSIDIIFSSNVLEHITDLETAFSEMKRVLKRNGIMVHTVPTQYSTIYTLALQPIGYLFQIGLMVSYGLKFAMVAIFGQKESAGSRTSAKKSRRYPDLNKRNIHEALKMANPIRFFISWPHGTSPNCFSEISDWKPENWRKRFEQAGLNVKDVIQLPMAYSRHMILPFKLMKLRHWLAKRGKNACVAYLIQCEE